MAFYDNQHWLLSHIRDSFISTDDTGLCEMIMVGEDIPNRVKNEGYKCYPGMEESDDEELDTMSDSYDIQMDMEFGHRARSNTAQHLEKIVQDRRKAAKVKHVKLDEKPGNMSLDQISELFKRKDLSKKDSKGQVRQSMFSDQFEKAELLPENPFAEYARFDGTGQPPNLVRNYRIFMSMLPKEERRYPMHVVVFVSVKVIEFIGLICHNYTNEHPDHPLIKDVTKYGLYIPEDDGEIDFDLSCLVNSDPLAKYKFTTLGLAEMTERDQAKNEAAGSLIAPIVEDVCVEDETDQEEFAADLARMEGHTTAMEAPIYQLYRVNIVNKVRAKTEIHLGISGEKVEIDPVMIGKGAGRFWNRQRSVSYHMDSIAWCELTENRGSKTSFILVYTTHPSTNDGTVPSSSQTHSLHQSASFKNHEFEADYATADEIVRKVNHILELRSSNSRKEYLAHKERKAARRKSFHLHR